MGRGELLDRVRVIGRPQRRSRDRVSGPGRALQGIAVVTTRFTVVGSDSVIVRRVDQIILLARGIRLQLSHLSAVLFPFATISSHSVGSLTHFLQQLG